VTINATTSAATSFSVEVSFDASKPTEGTQFHRLAARSVIRDLDTGRSYMHDDTSGLIPGLTKNDVDQAIIQMSTKYGVLSKLTAFVAVEEREEATEGSMQRRDVHAQIAPQVTSSRSFGRSYPMSSSSSFSSSMVGMMATSKSSRGEDKKERKRMVKKKSRKSDRSKSRSSLTNGAARPAQELLGKRFSSSPPAAPMALECSSSAARPPPSRSSSAARPPLSPRLSSKACEEEKEKECDLSRGESDEEEDSFDEMDGTTIEQESQQQSPQPPQPQETPSVVMNIIMKQKASGAWNLADVASTLPSMSTNKILETSSLGIKITQELEDIWATAVVCAYLEIKWADFKINWELVVSKAQKYLARSAQKLDAAKDVDWKDLAAKWVQAL